MPKLPLTLLPPLALALLAVRTTGALLVALLQARQLLSRLAPAVQRLLLSVEYRRELPKIPGRAQGAVCGAPPDSPLPSSPDAVTDGY